METPQARLNRYLTARSDALDITLLEVARRAEIGRSTLEKVRRTVEHTLRRTRRKLAEGLGWTPESIDIILAGGEPILAPVEPTPPTHTTVSADALNAAVERLHQAEGALAHAQGELNAAQAALRAMIDRDLNDPPSAVRWSADGHMSHAI